MAPNLFHRDRLIVKDERASKILLELCADINSDEMVIAPEYLLVVRKSMMTYLTNALMFNVHYKDIGHTNLMHLTAFPIYPLEEEHPVDAYPLFVRLFENTQAFNGGYVKHCASAVVTALLDQHPFVTRRDFDLTLTYFVLTGAVQLSRTVCRSYLFKGSYNPLADVYKSYLVASKISRPLVAAATPKGVWAPYPEDDSAWFLSAPTDGWSRPLLLLGLKFGDGYSMQHWTPGRIKSFSILCDRAYNPVHYPTIAVTTPKLIGDHTAGLFVINGGESGLVVNHRECHPQVFVWDRLGLYRFDSLLDYLFSAMGRDVRRIEKICEK